MPSSLKTKLRSLRDKYGMSLDNLSEKSGVSKSYLWELENREKGNPSIEKLSMIADSLNVSLCYLIEDDVDQPNEEMHREAFFRKFDRLEPEVKQKIEDLIDVWSNE